MLKIIVAIDEKRGMANSTGIPWKLSGDIKHVKELTLNGTLIMGRGTYEEFDAPLPDRQNVVITSKQDVRTGFIAYANLDQALRDFPDAWVFGGAAIYKSTINKVEKLYITHVLRDYNCTKFFPEFNDYELETKSKIITENGLSYYFATYLRNA